MSISDPTNKSSLQTICLTILVCLTSYCNISKVDWLDETRLEAVFLSVFVCYFFYSVVQFNCRILKYKSSYTHTFFVNFCFIIFAVVLAIRISLHYCISQNHMFKTMYASAFLMTIYTFILIVVVLTVGCLS